MTKLPKVRFDISVLERKIDNTKDKDTKDALFLLKTLVECAQSDTLKMAESAIEFRMGILRQFQEIFETIYGDMFLHWWDENVNHHNFVDGPHVVGNGWLCPNRHSGCCKCVV